MNNRKFTDSELRAYSKNRFEQRVLKQRLEKLKEEFGEYHDFTVKQRADLINETKAIRKTTGGSRKPGELSVFGDEEDEFDLSKRVNRPWAYSAMETTYNIVYKDAVIPPPRKRSQSFRSKSATALPRPFDSRPSTTASTPRNRLWSSKSYDHPSKSLVSFSSDESGDQRMQYSRCNSNPEMRLNNPSMIIRSVSSNSRRDEKLQAINEHSNPESVCQNGNETINGVDRLRVNASKQCQDTVDGVGHAQNDELSLHSNSVTIERDREQRQLTGSYKAPNGETLQEDIVELKTNVDFTTPVELKYDTTLIRLPPVHEIDSQAYQQAERERAASRARSRVSFSHNVGVVVSTREQPKTANTGDKKTCSIGDKIVTETKGTDTGIQQKTTENGDVKSVSQMNAEEMKTVESLKGVAINDDDDDSVNAADTSDSKVVKYRGKVIHNYIRPEDRYKLDPLIMKRRQSRMDRLAKESITFLKRVNHENIRVEIAFPRSARKRLLTRLVEDNNSSKGRKFEDTDGPVIQSKIQHFMTSMSDYIHLQRTEALKWHT